MKLKKLHIYTFLSFQIILTISCLTNNSTSEPLPLFYPNDAGDTLYREDVPFRVSFAIPETSIVDLSIVDQNGITLIQLVSSQLQAGLHNIWWSPTNEMNGMVYRMILTAKTDFDSVISESQNTFLLLSRGDIHNDIMEFADLHWSEEIYRDYEYRLALEYWGNSDPFRGTQVEWENLSWIEKNNYLPSSFGPDRKNYPHLLPNNGSVNKYWLIGVYSGQFGIAWDDQNGDEPSSPYWDGESVHYLQYRELLGLN